MGEDRLTGLALRQCHRERALLLDSSRCTGSQLCSHAPQEDGPGECVQDGMKDVKGVKTSTVNSEPALHSSK